MFVIDDLHIAKMLHLFSKFYPHVVVVLQENIAAVAATSAMRMI